jgi:hypothetical protein
MMLIILNQRKEREMKKTLVSIMACAFILSFAGLTMAADEKKTEAKPAAPTAATPAAPAPQEKPAKVKSSDDIKWIAQCIKDNEDEGQPTDVVQKYCECVREKMDENETKSVTQWEKNHKKEQKECADKAGWK